MTKQHIRVKPDIDLNAPEGMTMFSFDRSLIMDMAVLLKEVPLPQTANDLQCKLCTKVADTEPVGWVNFWPGCSLVPKY